MGIIYKITNTVNGKVYIGQTIRTLEIRKRQHFSSVKYKHRACAKLKNAMIKHGIENFIMEKIDEADSIEKLNELEIMYIDRYDSVNTGYNLTYGGKNAKPSNETRKKLSEAHKKQDISYLHTPEIREKIRNSLKGKKYNGPITKPGTRSKEVCVNGNTYSHILLAAKEEGISPGTLYNVLSGRKRSNVFTAFYTNPENRPVEVPRKPQRLPSNTLPIEFEGVTYRSLSEASRVTGLSRRIVQKRGKLIPRS